MSDPKTSLPPLAAPKPGSPPPAAAPARMAGASAPLAAAPAVAAGQSVPLFGGHRGGGKKRADGLPAGSPEAKAADRAKDAARMAARRAATKAAAMPAPLPSAPAPAAAAPGDSPAAVAGGASPLPLPAAGAGVAVVLWHPRLLEKPARLLTRIGDRLQASAARKRLDHPNLPAEMRAEIERDLPLPPEVLNDLSAALAECGAVELNKRGIGATQSHWLTLCGSLVEVGAHLVTRNERLDKILAKIEEGGPQTTDHRPQTEKGGAA